MNNKKNTNIEIPQEILEKFALKEFKDENQDYAYLGSILCEYASAKFGVGVKNLNNLKVTQFTTNNINKPILVIASLKEAKKQQIHLITGTLKHALKIMSKEKPNPNIDGTDFKFAKKFVESEVCLETHHLQPLMEILQEILK